MLAFALRGARFLGWLCLTIGVVAPIVALGLVALDGPPGWQQLRLSPRLAAVFLHTLAIAAAAAALALLLALPACFALTHARRPAARALLYGLMLFPLVTPPCVYGYACMLAATQQHPLARLLDAAGFNSAPAAPLRAAVALALWLWPVPALIAAAAFEHAGRAAYRLARLDASAPLAFLRAALPAMAGPILAGLAVTFVLALNDSTIPPLVLAHTWPAEMAPEVLDAALYGSPAAAVLWRSWPVLATLAAAVLAALPGLRELLRRTESDAAVDAGGLTLPAGRLGAISAVLVAVVALLPLIVFFADLYAAPVPLGGAFRRAWTLYAAERDASLIVAGCAAMVAPLVALAPLSLAPPRPSAVRAARGLIYAAALLTAVLPPELVAQLLVQIFNRPGLPGRLYDGTPVVWLAAIVARFAFLPLAIAWVAARHIPHDLVRQARTDGASGPRLLADLGLPYLARPLAAAALVFACLSLSEVAASFILIPPRFGGSLAVAIDNQMHYGRNNDLIATTLMLLTPALLIALAAPLLLARRRPPPLRRPA